MHTEYSITLTPSHNSVPALMDFIIDHAEKPYPARKDMVDMLTSLDRAGIKRLNMRLCKGEWFVEFIINESVKVRGKAKLFNEAIANALREVKSWPAHAAVSA
jgi:hypothetical protein